MGKSAGNAPLELVIMYYNREFGEYYDINPVLEAIDMHILKIYRQKYWGFSLQFYLSASNDCHPRYVEYLLGKKTVTIKDINQIIGLVPAQNKLDYNEKIIEELYIQYQNNAKGYCRDDTDEFFDIVSKQNVLLLGPGKMILSYQEEINTYIEKEKPIVIAVNFYPKHIKCDYIFISNAKRYDMIVCEYQQKQSDIKLAVTNNAVSDKKSYDYILSYYKLLDENEYIRDNGLMMMLNGMIGHGINQVMLAGFDGFSVKGLGNYYSEHLELSDDCQHLLKTNTNMKERIRTLGKKIHIDFLTPSLYKD